MDYYLGTTTSHITKNYCRKLTVGEEIQVIQTQKYLHSVNENNCTSCMFRPIRAIFREVI